MRGRVIVELYVDIELIHRSRRPARYIEVVPHAGDSRRHVRCSPRSSAVTGNVRFGSLTDIATSAHDVRFTPKSNTSRAAFRMSPKGQKRTDIDLIRFYRSRTAPVPVRCSGARYPPKSDPSNKWIFFNCARSQHIAPTFLRRRRPCRLRFCRRQIFEKERPDD